MEEIAVLYVNGKANKIVVTEVQGCNFSLFTHATPVPFMALHSMVTKSWGLISLVEENGQGQFF